MYYMTWSKRNNAAATQARRDAWTQAQDTQPRAEHDHAGTRLHADHKAAHRHDHAGTSASHRGRQKKMTYTRKATCDILRIS